MKRLLWFGPLFIAFLVVAPGSGADDPKKDGAKAPAAEEPSPITKANLEKIIAAEGKWSMEDVAKLLGPVQRARHFADISDFVWEDLTGIRADFRDGKAVDFSAEFSKRLPSKRINLDAWKQLRLKMTEAEVKKILGPDTPFKYGGGTDFQNGFSPLRLPLVVPRGMTVICWYKMRRITVQFKDGKVSGHTWMQSE